jgi:glucose-6-phosphate isomerase
LNHPEHHTGLLANMLAQMGALAFGQGDVPSPHDIYKGGRPSNLIMLKKLDPYNFGMLLALYEHKVFVQGAVWNINSFDQPGVELGKRMARTLEGQRSSGNPDDRFLADFWHKIRPL